MSVCASLSLQISRLVDDIQRLQSNLSRLREASSVQVKSLEDQLAQKTELIASLELNLASQSDYEELKRELSVIKMVEFSTASSSASLAQEAGATTAQAEAVSEPLLIGLIDSILCDYDRVPLPSLWRYFCWRKTDVSYVHLYSRF